MKFLILIVAVSTLYVFGKPKRKEFRIVVMPHKGYTIYVPEYKDKKSLFGPKWHPVNQFTPYYYDFEAAKMLVEEMKYDDSLDVALAKASYIYF